MSANYTGSILNLEYTRSFSKISCHRDFYFIHVVCCYFVFLSGIACFITRAWCRFKWLHASFGRIYIISMLWATASSLLINNTGLPDAVLISFAYTMAGLPLAWFFIKVHQWNLDRAVTESVDMKLKESTNQYIGIKELYDMERSKIIDGMSWKQRLFSYKTLHGTLMLLSWWGIAGRIFFSNQSGDFTCYTYPAYKPVDATMGGTAGMNLGSEPLTLVPEIDPDYDRLPWAGSETMWGVQGFFTPVCIGLLVATIWTYCSSKKTETEELNESNSNEQVDGSTPSTCSTGDAENC